MSASARTIDPSERIAELEAEVAYFKGELGLAVDVDRLDRLRLVIGLTPLEMRLMLALAAGKGRAMSRALIAESLPETWGTGRDIKIVDTLVSKIRRKLGVEVIGTIPGFVYRITPEGLALIAEREALLPELG